MIHMEKNDYSLFTVKLFPSIVLGITATSTSGVKFNEGGNFPKIRVRKHSNASNAFQGPIKDATKRTKFPLFVLRCELTGVVGSSERQSYLGKTRRDTRCNCSLVEAPS